MKEKVEKKGLGTLSEFHEKKKKRLKEEVPKLCFKD